MESYFVLSYDAIQYFYLTPSSQLLNANNAYETVFALITLVVVICQPLLISCYLRHKFSLFRVTSFRNKFRDIIGQLNWRVHASTNYISIFCYRRLLQVLLITFCQSRLYLQVMAINQTSVIVIVIFGVSNVFYWAKDRRMELFNEAIILGCIYHYYLFSNFVPDPKIRS